MAEKLKIIPLGGLNEIGKNMTVLEYGKDIIIVDCGLGFPDDEMYGVDLVIADMTYLVKNKDRIRGMFLTHGHEDHIGGIPYAMEQFRCPIHATRLTAGIVQLKLEEHQLQNAVHLFTHEAGEKVKAGCFTVEFIHVNHSIADAVAFAIKTPVGTVVMTGDFKIDATAEDGMIDLARFGALGKEGVLALLCDSTNVERQGYTPSERTVAGSFERQFTGCNKRIIVTTFASNAFRLQSLITVAKKFGRKVAVTGRSMENILKVSTELGYLKIPAGTLVDINQIKQIPNNKLVIVSTGSQGENMSALYRMAFSGHRQVEITASDRVIISASAIPGNEKSIGKIINELYRKGAEVIYEKMYDVHVSGHACQDEQKLMMALTRPKYILPVHGEYKHLRKYAMVAKQMGIDEDHVIIPAIGQVLETDGEVFRLGGEVPSGAVMVDGLGVGDVGSIVLRDRKHLAEDGLIVVVAAINTKTKKIVAGPDIISRGFVHVREAEDMINGARDLAKNTLEESMNNGVRDWTSLKNRMKDEVSRYVYNKTKRSPMILTVIQEA